MHMGIELVTHAGVVAEEQDGRREKGGRKGDAHDSNGHQACPASRAAPYTQVAAHGWPEGEMMQGCEQL